MFIRNILQHYLSPLHVSCRVCDFLDIIGVKYRKSSVTKKMKWYQNVYKSCGL